MRTMQDPPPSGTPPQRPSAPPGCDIRRNQSESPVGGARHHRGSFPSSLSSPQIAPSGSSRITAREQERRFRQSARNERQRSPVRGARHHRGSMRIPVREQERRSRQSARNERQRRDSDPRRMNNAQNRGRRSRPEITFLSAQPMAVNQAFADGNKGGYVPPEAPPSYEQAMREPPPVNPTFTNPAAPDHIYEVRRIYPHVINSDAIAIPSYTDSVASHTTTVTSSAGTISLVASASYSSTSSVTSERDILSSIVTSQPGPSPVRPRRNINSNNNSIEGSLQEERGRQSPDCASRSSQSSPSTSSSASTDNPLQSRQKPALPSKRPVLRPKPRTTIQTRSETNSKPVLNTNNNSNRRDGTNTPSPTRPVPPYNPVPTSSTSDTPEGATLQPSSRTSHSRITSNQPIGTRTSSSVSDHTINPSSNISRIPKTTSSPNNFHGQNASCTVTTSTSSTPSVSITTNSPSTTSTRSVSITTNSTSTTSTPSVSITTNSPSFAENMSARPGNQDLMDLFGSQMSGSTQSLPAPLLPSSNTPRNTPHKPNTMSSGSDFSGFDPFSNQPQSGSQQPPMENMFSAPLLPSSNLSPPNGVIASAQRPPAAVLRPTQLPVHNMTPSATPRAQTSQNIAQSTGAPQPVKPPPHSLPLAPSVAQPGAILTPLPSLNRLQTGASTTTMQTNAISPTGSNNSLPSPSGNPASRKLPPPPRPPSGPKRAPSMKIQSSQSPMLGTAQMTSPTKPSLPTKPTLDGASTTPTKPTQGGSNVPSKQQLAGNNPTPSLLDFGLPQGDSNEKYQKQTLGGSSAAPLLMDALLLPSSGSALTPEGTKGLGAAPQTMDLFSMDLLENKPHPSGVMAPTTMNPAPVPRKNTPHTTKVPNLSDTGPNPKIEPVYAAITKKKTVHFTPGEEGASTPTSTPSGGESLLDMLEPSKSNLVASELEESFVPPLPASRPPLEDFEDLLSPTEMSKAMAEREVARKNVQSPPQPAPRYAATQNTDSLDDLLGFGPSGSKNGSKPSQEDNPYEFEDIFLNVEDRGLPHIAQSTPPLVLPAPRNKKKKSASGPPPLPKSQPKMASGGTVIYNAAESPSPEATLVMQQKKPEEEKFTKKIRRQSMRIKKSAMDVFKSKKTVESESNLPEQTEKNESGESPKNPTAKSPAAVQNKPKPPRPAGPPPPRPTNLPSKSPSLMQSIQPHLISPTVTRPSQNFGNAPLISPINTAPPQTSADPFASTPNTTPLISFASADPPQILNPNPIAKPKPSKPPPPKIVPTRAAPARPPPIANSNQNNRTQKPTPSPQNLTPGTPTPKPRSGSKIILENQTLPPPMMACPPTIPQNQTRPLPMTAGFPTIPQNQMLPPLITTGRPGPPTIPQNQTQPPLMTATRPGPPTIPQNQTEPPPLMTAARPSPQTIPHNQTQPPLMTTARPGPPTRAAPIRPPAKPLRSPPAVPPPKKGAKLPASRSSKPELPPKPAPGGSSVLQSPALGGARTQHPKPIGNVMQVPQSGLTSPQEGDKLKHKITDGPPQDGAKLQDKITDVTDGPNQDMNPVIPESNLTAVAIYDFNGAADDELSFHASDKITGVTVVTDDWYKGWLNGKCGIFPRGFVDVDTGDGNASPVIESTPMNSTPDSFPTWDDESEVLPEKFGESPEPPSSSPERVNTPSSDQFFDAKEDFLESVSNSDTTPVNTLSMHISETTVSMTTTPQSDDVHMTTVMVRRTSIALFPFIGQDDSELTFAEGDTIEILGGINEEWLTGELDGKQGIFPAAYVEQQPPDGASDNAGTTNQDSTNTPIPTSKTDTTMPSSEGFVEPMATGIKDYTAPSSEEVSFKVGDILYLLEQVDEDWLMVQNDRSSAVGNVPVSHVKIIHPLPEAGGTMNWNS